MLNNVVAGNLSNINCYQVYTEARVHIVEHHPCKHPYAGVATGQFLRIQGRLKYNNRAITLIEQSP